MAGKNSKQLWSRKWIKRAFWTLGVLGSFVLLLVTVLAVYVTLIDREIEKRFTQLSSTRSSRFYAPYPAFTGGQVFTEKSLESLLEDMGYKKTVGEQNGSTATYRWDPEIRSDAIRSLSINRGAFSGAGKTLAKIRAAILFDKDGENLTIQEIVDVDTRKSLKKLEHIPKQMGYFFAGRLRTQHSVALSNIPVSVRLAVMGVEDTRFLEHHGVSIRGTIRALWKDVLARKWVQGGSTITQQLMKNLFFSNEKVLSRKLKEWFYAFVTEARQSKEAILEAYLNEVYLGQWNGHEIHGVSEAARYYFNKSIRDVSLSQAATLGGMIQRPNYFNPHRFPERTQKRRNLVLRKMLDVGFILKPEYEKAIAAPLEIAAVSKSLTDAAYFMDLVLDTLPQQFKKRLDTDALTIYLSLNPYLQSLASKSLSTHLDRMEGYFKSLKDKKQQGFDLQGALVALDPSNCTVLALQGGKSFKQTQFNRVTQGKRQAGSLFKPFVYLTAFSDADSPITPLTELEDAPFEWKYEGQTWIPNNYDEEFRGVVTTREALQLSINVPTARLANQVGLKPILGTLREAGIASKLPKVPSISLGSAEVSPLELAQAYATVANLGQWCELRSFSEIYDENRNLIYTNKKKSEDRLNPEATFQTVQLMKGVIQEGTAKLATARGIATENFAGKTGTTNDFKDAWFVGFSPEILALVWVGYDEKQTVGLPGAAAALPIWIDFVKNARAYYGDNDFYKPDGLIAVQVDRKERCTVRVATERSRWEYFVPGTEPAQCMN